LTIAVLPDCDGIEIDIHLGCDQRFRKEGELVVTIREATTKRPIMTLTLAFERLSDGRSCCYLGCLQGSVGSGARIKQLTKALHGLRPAALLLAVAREIALIHGTNRVLGVGSAIQVHRRKHFIHMPFAHALHFDYDAFWRERGGVENEDGWFALPVTSARRSQADTPSNKRAQYARRYRLMDAIGLQLRANLQVTWPLAA
jgi:uncharacterized protein VirK/YbjX